MKQLKKLCYALVISGLMALLGGSAASATELYAGGTTLSAGTSFSVTMAPATSAVLTSTDGKTVLGTCTGTSMEGTTENSSGAVITGNLSSLVASGCSMTMDTVTPGSLSIAHITGTDNGTVTGKNSLVTFTVFGVSCRYGFGEGTHIGTLVGKTNTSEHATIAVNTIINEQAPKALLCPDTANWTTSYVVTTPTGLNVRES